MQYLLNEKAYQILKWVGLVALPALAVFVGAVGPAWGFANVDAITLTLNATGVLIGALIGYSQATARNTIGTQQEDSEPSTQADDTTAE